MLFELLSSELEDYRCRSLLGFASLSTNLHKQHIMLTFFFAFTSQRIKLTVHKTSVSHYNNSSNPQFSVYDKKRTSSLRLEQKQISKLIH